MINFNIIVFRKISNYMHMGGRLWSSGRYTCFGVRGPQLDSQVANKIDNDLQFKTTILVGGEDVKPFIHWFFKLYMYYTNGKKKIRYFYVTGYNINILIVFCRGVMVECILGLKTFQEQKKKKRDSNDKISVNIVHCVMCISD